MALPESFPHTVDCKRIKKVSNGITPLSLSIRKMIEDCHLDQYHPFNKQHPSFDSLFPCSLGLEQFLMGDAFHKFGGLMHKMDDVV